MNIEVQKSQFNFYGGSFVYDAFAKESIKADDQEKILVVKLNLEHSVFCNNMWGLRKNRLPDSAYKDVKVLPIATESES